MQNRRCPQGYQMINGVCTETSTRGLGNKGGDSTLEHHSSNCNDCMHQCWGSTSHCFGSFSYPPGGQCSCNAVCNSWVTVEYPCNHNPEMMCSESGCGWGDYTYYCYSNVDCASQCSYMCSGLGYSGPGSGGGGSRDWKKGGKIKRRGRI